MKAPTCPHAISGCNSPESHCIGLCTAPRPYQPLPTITVKLPIDQAVAVYMAMTGTPPGQLGERVRLARRALMQAISDQPV